MKLDVFECVEEANGIRSRRSVVVFLFLVVGGLEERLEERLEEWLEKGMAFVRWLLVVASL